jgi:adenosine deaminase/aminodeoxyfutalosine deaminase
MRDPFPRPAIHDIDSAQSLEAWIHALPKVELHLHLEGSVQPETLRELSRVKGRLERETEAWIRQQEERNFRYGNLPEFLNAFKLVSLLLESPSDYALVTERLLQSLAAQNVRYAEITLSAGVILWKRQSLPGTFEAVSEVARRFESVAPLKVRWIFDAVRQFGTDHAREVLGWARMFRGRDVVAFGIGGDEERGPAELFKDVYQEARNDGLHCIAHAGEGHNPAGMHQAIRLLKPERIGHGIAAARDPEVVQLLRDHETPLEICLTSNISTGLFKDVRDHPMKQLWDAGVRVTLNTDDPALFATNLEDEFALATRVFGFGPAEIMTLCQNAIEASFMTENEKREFRTRLYQAACGPPGQANP